MTLEEARSYLLEMCTTQSNCAEYRAIHLAIGALNKQIPEEVEEVHCDEYYCPACGAENNADQHIVDDDYCPRCGQRLKVRKEDEY